jgi:hypothetical protein
MKRFFMAAAIAFGCATAGAADRVVVTVTTAQDDANEMARTGVLRHRGRNGGCREGIGCGPTAAAALANCCFNNGRYVIRERGVARGANGRYFAVIRYGN